MGLDQAEGIVVKILNFVASDGVRLARFLNLTGFRAETLREASQSRLFMLHVLDAIAKDENLLQQLNEHEGVQPEMVELARSRLAFQAVAEVTRPASGESEGSAIKERIKQLMLSVARRS
jgi:hypothetical protein